MKRYTITFKIETYENWESTAELEKQLKDIINKVVAPTFNFNIAPLSFEVKNARK